jgi:hypothetical protein
MNRTTCPEAGVLFEFLAVAVMCSVPPARTPVCGVNARLDGVTVFCTVYVDVAVHLLGGVPVGALLQLVPDEGIVAVIEPEPVSVDAVDSVTDAVPSGPVVTAAEDAPPIEPGPLCVKLTLTPWTAFPNLSVTVAVNFWLEPGLIVGLAGVSALV